MTVYLGTLGRMVELWSTPSAQVQAEDRYSFIITLEGRRKAQVRSTGRRTWSLNAQFADPRESASLAQFASGAWGAGPFIFVPADAPGTNLLLPSVADCLSSENPSGAVTDGGPVQVDGVWFARSYLNPAPVTMFFGGTAERGSVPVIQGKHVTASVYLTGSGARVQLAFYNAAGVSLGSYLGSPVAGPSGWVRSHVTVMPPVGAVSARVFANSSTVRAVAPAITWSGELLPWGSGQGCAKSVVHGVSRDVQTSGVNGTFSNLSFTVTEVG